MSLLLKFQLYSPKFMPIKTIFLDRDGVINKEVNYLFKISEFEFIDGIFDALINFQKLDYQIIIITNQSGIARKYYKEKDYQILTKWMLGQFQEQGIKILDIFHCPHDPNASCDCRKPKPGMIEKAKDIYDIDIKNSVLIDNLEKPILEQTINKIIENKKSISEIVVFAPYYSHVDRILDKINTKLNPNLIKLCIQKDNHYLI